MTEENTMYFRFCCQYGDSCLAYLSTNSCGWSDVSTQTHCLKVREINQHATIVLTALSSVIATGFIRFLVKSAIYPGNPVCEAHTLSIDTLTGTPPAAVWKRSRSP